MIKKITFGIVTLFTCVFLLIVLTSCGPKIFRFDNKGDIFYDSLLKIYRTKGRDSVAQFAVKNKEFYTKSYVEAFADRATYLNPTDTLLAIARILASNHNNLCETAYIDFKEAHKLIEKKDYKTAKVLMDSVSKVMEMVNWEIVDNLKVDRIDFYTAEMELGNAFLDNAKVLEYYNRILFWYSRQSHGFYSVVSTQTFLIATIHLSENLRLNGKFSEAMDTLEKGYKQYRIPMTGGKHHRIQNIHYYYLYRYHLQKAIILVSQKQYKQALFAYESALFNITYYKSKLYTSKNSANKTPSEISMDKEIEELNNKISEIYILYASAEKKNYFDFVLDKTTLKSKISLEGLVLPDSLLEDSTMILILTSDAYLKQYNLKYAKGMLKIAEQRLKAHPNSQIQYFVSKSYGDLYFKCGDYSKALNYYRTFDNQTKTFTDSIASFQKNKVLQKVFQSYLLLNKPDSALIALNQLSGNKSLSDNIENQVLFNMFKGDYLRLTGKTDSSSYYYTLASQLNDSNNLQYYAEVRERLGYANKFKNPELAEDYFYDAMQVYSARADYEKTADMLLEFGNTFETRGKKNSAMELYLREISLLELVKQVIHDPEMKKFFTKKIDAKYNEIITFFVKNNFALPAYVALESYKSRLFLEMVAENFFDLTIKLPISTKIELDDFDGQYNSTLLKLYIERLRKIPELSTIYELSKKVDALQDKIKNFKTLIKPNINVNYLDVKYPKIADIASLNSDKIIRKDECILRYFMCNDSIYCCLISDKNNSIGIELIPLGVSSLQIDDEVTSYHKLVKFKDSLVLQPASVLYDKLIKPLAGAITDKNLIIIADGKLSSLPFEALYDNSENGKKFLIEKNSVKYIQSVSLLSYLRKYLNVFDQGKRFIGFGDPVFDYSNYLKGKVESDTIENTREITRDFRDAGGNFARLPATRDEVLKICQIFKDKNTGSSTEDTLLLRIDANEKNAKSPHLSDYSYIHFASHGVMSDNIQAIVLSQVPDSTEDGFLTTGELLNFKLHSKLVSFSACKTGWGNNDNLNGIPGFTSAIMYAGSQAAIVTLWNVEDYSAKNLMLKFYDYHISLSLSKEEAMRKAKISFINSDKYSHPFYWAGFVMYGE